MGPAAGVLWMLMQPETRRAIDGSDPEQSRDRQPHLRTKQPPAPWVPDRPEPQPILPAITRIIGAVFRPRGRAGNAPRSPQPSLRGGHREAPEGPV